MDAISQFSVEYCRYRWGGKFCLHSQRRLCRLDSFMYRAGDGTDASDPVLVTIHVGNLVPSTDESRSDGMSSDICVASERANAMDSLLALVLGRRQLTSTVRTVFLHAKSHPPHHQNCEKKHRQTNSESESFAPTGCHEQVPQQEKW